MNQVTRHKVRIQARAACLFALLGALVAGCAVVPQNRRQYLADPTMRLVDAPLEAQAKNKLYGSREAAAGGNARAAGGGCGCSN